MPKAPVERAENLAMPEDHHSREEDPATSKAEVDTEEKPAMPEDCHNSTESNKLEAQVSTEGESAMPEDHLDRDETPSYAGGLKADQVNPTLPGDLSADDRSPASPEGPFGEKLMSEINNMK